MLFHRIARHEFAASALPADTFRVVTFEGDEAISQPYRFEINLVSNDPEILFEDVLGQPATLTMYRGDEPSEVAGIVVDFEQSMMHHGQTEYPYVYRAVLMPRLSRLGLSFQSRIFQNLTVEEIVRKVLEAADVEADVKLSGSYALRDYCTQYKETDLDFVQRLLEYEGIRYHFTHDGMHETLVLSDDSSDAPDIAGLHTLPYRHSAGLLSSDSAEFVGEFVARQQIVTAKTQIKDRNYRDPETEIVVESEIDAELATGIESDYGTHVMDSGRATRLVTIRNEEIETGRLVMTGGSDCQRFRSGHHFALEEHYREGHNQTYLLTHVHHTGSQSSTAAAGGEAATGYRNTFGCVPASVPYRPPRRTPEPKLPGVLTARVESGGGDYAPVDDQGRYHVRMPFDLGDTGAAQATKAVRLAQPYTGPGYGQHFPVHKDTEMVVACVDGNVDRVLGLSTIYNPTQFSPVTNGNAAQNVLRSWGKNELTFDDTKGAENVYMHATKDHNVEVVNDENVTVGTNRTQQVGNDEALKVGHDQSESIGHDHRFDIGNNQSITVGLNRSMDVAVNLTESVGSSMSLSVGANKTESVGSVSSLSIGAAYTIDVGAAKTESVGALSSETVGGMKSIEAGAVVSLKAGASMSLTSGAAFEVKADGAGSIHFAKEGALQTGKDLKITVGKKAVIEVADQLTLKCGSAEIVLKKNGDISIKGGKIDLKGSKKMSLKGSQIAEN